MIVGSLGVDDSEVRNKSIILLEEYINWLSDEELKYDPSVLFPAYKKANLICALNMIKTIPFDKNKIVENITYVREKLDEDTFCGC